MRRIAAMTHNIIWHQVLPMGFDRFEIFTMLRLVFVSFGIFGGLATQLYQKKGGALFFYFKNLKPGINKDIQLFAL
jgi:hypothetical protein